jgi:hypothetical protein
MCATATEFGSIATGLARTSDPDTSHAAAGTLGSHAETMRVRLLEAIQAGAKTAEEAADACGYTANNGAWKRVSDLKTAGRVRDTGIRRPGRSGRAQVVWEAV